jgi:hypothetical protein
MRTGYHWSLTGPVAIVNSHSSSSGALGAPASQGARIAELMNFYIKRVTLGAQTRMFRQTRIEPTWHVALCHPELNIHCNDIRMQQQLLKTYAYKNSFWWQADHDVQAAAKQLELSAVLLVITMADLHTLSPTQLRTGFHASDLA